MMRALFLAVLLALYAAPSALAWDAGVLLGQSFSISGDWSNGNGDSQDMEARTSVVPWFTASLGTRAEVYLSAGISFEYPADGWSLIDDVQLVPEAFRFELSFAPSDTFGISLGRIPFRDSLGWVMEGLFDGISLSSSNSWGRIDAGVFYTGLLYKDAVSINLSQYDAYNGNNRYFAPSRIVGSISWEQTGIFETRSTLRLGGLLQADLNAADVEVHSQYFLAGTSISFGRGFSFELGTALSLTQVLQELDMNMYPALAASLDFRWQHSGVETAIPPSMLSFGGKVASGDWGETIGVFVPFSGPALGRVILPEFSGVAMVRLAFAQATRQQRAFFELFFAGLFRTDTVTFTGGHDDSFDELFLGLEVFFNIYWAPFTDLIFTLGGGLFLPGNTTMNTSHRLELTAVFSL